MAKNKQPVTINIEHSMKYDKEFNLYTIQMVHRRRPWWLLLLLLPLLLFIQCHKDITVNCLEPDTNAPIADQPVNLQYQAHYLLKDWRFLATDNIDMTQNTDSTGQTVFRDLPCSVFSYIFYCLSQATFTAKSDCHAAAGEKYNFHYTRTVDLKMLPRKEDLHVTLYDLETGDPLPGAELTYTYVEQGEEKSEKVKADASGVATMPQMRFCSVMKQLLGQCYGYADTTRVNVPCQRLLQANDSTALYLRPIKARFTFFVKNAVTKQPIPEAECLVKLKRPGVSGKTDQLKVYTSTDGKGIASYDDAAILAEIYIHASKAHFKDNNLKDSPNGPWKVVEFIKQNDDTRTVWLEPDPYMQEFINVDSINGRPIAGVKNVIKVVSADGKSKTFTETSNRNGVFPVSAMEDDKIYITSTKSPEYKQKDSYYPKFKDIKDKKVRMQPVMVKLDFKTVDADKGSLLPSCNLQVSGSISGSLKPSNSGNGAFDVEFRMAEKLTIRASKAGYKNTTNKVNAQTYSILNSNANERTIPLKSDPLIYNYKKGKGTFTECYDLKEAPATFNFSWNLCSVCTMIIVTDKNGTELGRYGIDSPKGDNNGQRFSPSSGSTTLTSQTREVCITSVVVNACTADCTIRK